MGFNVARFIRDAAAFRAREFALASRAVTRTTQAIAAEAKANAPKDSGELADSISATPVKVTRAKITAKVEVDSKYAIDVEYGNFARPAHPFVRPAILGHRDDILNIIQGGD